MYFYSGACHRAQSNLVTEVKVMALENNKKNTNNNNNEHVLSCYSGVEYIVQTYIALIQSVRYTTTSTSVMRPAG